MEGTKVFVIFEHPPGVEGYQIRRYVGGIVDLEYDPHGAAVFSKLHDALYSIGDHMVKCEIPTRDPFAIYACRARGQAVKE